VNVSRLRPADAAKIVACFHRVYGDSYANELFYDTEKLAAAIAAHRVGCVGAVREDGLLLAHMAMTVRPDASVIELGNTVVDPVARGQGLAWKVGAELSAWSRELGYQGFLHYPTTDHHIMQRQSVKQGFETGLMLGYIPAETDGQVGDGDPAGRQAATIVYEPYVTGRSETCYLPEYCADRIERFAEATALTRHWRRPERPGVATSDARTRLFEKRGLTRVSVERVGQDVADLISKFDDPALPCRQIDLSMTDAGLEAGVRAALEAGFWFCGWLPGYGPADIFRLQKVDPESTDMRPAVVNEVAQSLLELIPG